MVKDLSVLTNIIFTASHAGDSFHMDISGRQEMAGRPRKERADKGTRRPRGKYKTNQDDTGKTVKENVAINSFWKTHKVADMMLLSSKELDQVIEEWLVNYQSTQLKRDKFWWYPMIYYEPYPEPKQKKKINRKFNTSFSEKKVI